MDLESLARRYRLPRSPDGDALQLPSGWRLVTWGRSGLLAAYGPFGPVVGPLRSAGCHLAYGRNEGVTLVFQAHRLGDVLAILEGRS